MSGSVRKSGATVRLLLRGREGLRRILVPVLLSCSLLLAGLPGGLQGQAITGRVTDRQTGEAVEAVRIQLLSARGDSLSLGFTDRFGDYRLRAPGPGEYRIRASRMGVGEVVTPPLILKEAGTEVVDLAITFTAIELDPLLVRQRPFRWWERDKPPSHWEFWERREFYERLGAGRFLSDGEAGRFRDLNELVYLQAPRILLCSGRVTLLVDGIRYPEAGLQVQGGRMMLDRADLFRMDQVEHVELYQGGLRVPGELVSPGSQCGVIAVWLKRGSQDR